MSERISVDMAPESTTGSEATRTSAMTLPRLDDMDRTLPAAQEGGNSAAGPTVPSDPLGTNGGDGNASHHNRRSAPCDLAITRREIPDLLT